MSTTTRLSDRSATPTRTELHMALTAARSLKAGASCEEDHDKAQVIIRFLTRHEDRFGDSFDALDHLDRELHPAKDTTV